ncbi:hypothetical protein CYY_001370 [Polysphondylium violaceum]|uniref:Rho-GAP domain-containing protein n=1 Tax=Polysphondylium violaceum TaxID=133409 RepID=A0A8J4Q3C3_9MYCE|nr:hypothetical protein CYY_001370 [Polysphondylium violaceum]
MSTNNTDQQQQQQESSSIKKKIVDFLTQFIKKRPPPEELRDKNILVAPSTVAPRIQSTRYELDQQLNHRQDSNSNSNSSNSNNSNNTKPTIKKENSFKDKDRWASTTGGMNDKPHRKETFKIAWDCIRNLDFTFSKFKYGKTVVHRLKFPQFGLSPEELQNLYPDQPHGIPLVLTKGFEYLSKYLETEGLFRVSGSKKDISLLKFRVEDGDLDFSTELNPYSICGLISTFFKELPEPLIPLDCYQEAIDSTKIDNREKRIQALKTLVLDLPPANLCILRRFLHFLLSIEKKKDINKMNSDNLGIIFGPTLLKDPEFADITTSLGNLKYQSLVIKYMLDHYGDIFQNSVVDKAYRKSIIPKEQIDTSSLNYLDIAEDSSSTRTSVSSNSSGGQRTSRPSRPGSNRKTLLLSPRTSGSSSALCYSTLTRPQSRVLLENNFEISPSPPPKTTQYSTSPLPPKPPKPPMRKIFKPQTNPNYQTYPLPMSKQPPLPPSAPPRSILKNTSMAPPPSKPQSKPPPQKLSNPISFQTPSSTTTTSSPISPSPPKDYSQTPPPPRAKPPPPKRTFTNYTIVDVELDSNNNSTKTTFEKPPNKPPPVPVELKKNPTPPATPPLSSSPTPFLTKKKVSIVEPSTTATTPPSLINKPIASKSSPPMVSASTKSQSMSSIKDYQEKLNSEQQTKASQPISVSYFSAKSKPLVKPTIASSSSTTTTTTTTTTNSRDDLNINSDKPSVAIPSKSRSALNLSTKQPGSPTNTPPSESPMSSSPPTTTHIAKFNHLTPSTLTVSQKIALNEKKIQVQTTKQQQFK